MNQKRVGLAIIQKRDGTVLIVQRKGSDTSSGLVWSFPGGEANAVQMAHHAAKMYTALETGYDISIKELIHERHHQDIPAFVSYFAAEVKGLQQEMKHPQIAQIQWVQPDEIRHYLTTDLDKTVEAYLQQHRFSPFQL